MQIQTITGMPIPGWLAAVAKSSTCHKRVVVCVLLDADNIVRSAAANHCEPPETGCSRLTLTSDRDSYPLLSPCAWEHAEIRALRAWHASKHYPTVTLLKARLWGHDFVCPHCEVELEKAGVRLIEIVKLLPDEEGIVGLRLQPQP